MVRSFASFDWLAKIATPPKGILNANVLLIFHLGCCFFSYIFEDLRDWMLWAFLHFTMRHYLLFFSPLFFVGRPSSAIANSGNGTAPASQRLRELNDNHFNSAITRLGESTPATRIKRHFCYIVLVVES